MYCRNCGNTILSNEMTCRKCGVTKNEGTKFCQTCGYFTNEKTEFCSNCGAKQKTIITQKMKVEKLQELLKQAKTCKTFMKLEKWCSIGLLILAIGLFVYSVTRPAPDDYSVSIMQGTGTTWHNDPNVLFYWRESQEHLIYILSCLVGAFGSFLGYLAEKSKYKKIIKAIKEAKNVL